MKRFNILVLLFHTINLKLRNMSKYKFIIKTLLIICLLSSTISAGYCSGAGTFNGEVSGRLIGHMSVFAETNASCGFEPIMIYDGDTYSGTGHTTQKETIPLECKYKTIIFKQHWAGAPKDVGGQIDVYTGGDIEFNAPLTWKIGSKSASSASITYKGSTHSCGAGGWIRWTPY
jgi:hypothetical protein